MEHHTSQPIEEGDIPNLFEHIASTTDEKTMLRLRETYHTYGAPFVAFLLLDDTKPEDPAIADKFTANYISTWDNFNDLLDNELDALGWADALAELYASQGIPSELLIWDRQLFASYVREIYSIVLLDGRYHVFYR